MTIPAARYAARWRSSIPRVAWRSTRASTSSIANHDPKDRVHFGGWAGHAAGVNFSAQGNTLASEEVVQGDGGRIPAGAKGTMAERLMDALEAGSVERRRHARHAGCRHSRRRTNYTRPPRPPTDRVIDIRVDDAPRVPSWSCGDCST